MAAPDKRMGKADLESFLNQQFPKSKEVNNLLEQITASKNRMEKAIGEEIPSFYGTISRLISAHTVNGISDWVNSNGQVNVNRINKAAEIAKKEFEVKKTQEQEAEQKQEQITTEYENTNEKDFKEKIQQIDFDKIDQESWLSVAEDIESFMDAPDEVVSKEDKCKYIDFTDKMVGTYDIYTILTKLAINPDLKNDPVIQEQLKNNPIAQKFIDETGEYNRKAIIDLFNKKVSAIRQIITLLENGESITEKSIIDTFKACGIDLNEYSNLIDVERILELTRDPENLNNFFEEQLEVRDKMLQEEEVAEIASISDGDTLSIEGFLDKNFSVLKTIASLESYREISVEDIQKIIEDANLSEKDIDIDLIMENLHKGSFKERIEGEVVKKSIQDVQRADEVLSAVEGSDFTEISVEDTEMFFDDLFAGAIDLAEQAEELGLPMQEGDGYTAFFEIEEGQQERGQDGIDGQEFGEADEIAKGQADKVAEIVQQGEDRAGEEVSQEVVRDTVDQMIGEEAPRQAVPDAMGVIGQLQNAAKEEPNDYTQEDTYQSPTLDNLEDNKQGGILGFFSKIKEAVQARFGKKPEQKRLNPSSEQRTDENGWNITTYDGNGKDLMPRGTGLRNAMVRFAENTIGRISKLTTNAPRSSEPINTPYVIPTNVQKREDKQQVVAKDKTNQWAVDPSRLAPLEHSKKEVDEQVQGDGER